MDGHHRAAAPPKAAASTRTTPGTRTTATVPPAAKVVPSAAAALFAVVIVGGYFFKWHWTGFSKDDQLWDMLHILVLPIVLATLPLWYRTRERWRVEWRVVLAAVVGAFVVVVIGGYGFDWSWTGFPGNTFWDWLELLALPVVVAFLPLWFETHRRLEGRWRLAFSAVFAGFLIVVLGGYQWHWAWTGFEGNTMRDWLQLLVVPFVLPASLAWFAARREAADAHGGDEFADSPKAGREIEVRLDVNARYPGDAVPAAPTAPALTDAAGRGSLL
ncbi:MAG: hypothetical protein ACRDV3_03170 [Acidothermaceae bacterium]